MDVMRKMFSVPPERPLTSTQRFNFVTALIAYVIGGLSLTFAPGFGNAIINLDLSPHDMGYFTLTGSGLTTIGFCYLVISRHKSSQIPNHSPLLGTVAGRLVLVNVVLIWFYAIKIINARFVLLITTLDSVLALQTYVIWSRETKDASFVKFCRDIWSTIIPSSQRPLRYTIFQALGYAQFFASFLAPLLLMTSGVVPSSIRGSHVEGLFRSFFFTMGVHAVLQILASGSQNDSFPMVAVCYRMMWNIPLFIFLSITSQIPRALSNLLIMYDVTFMIITMALFATGHRVDKKN
ncbi:uncharacterized protein LOC114527910 isoform X1 [Dendronephthya gigantea]|uniref:uncharacterized protein LOC114527910 isoform X1 n=1 Tax=Dendronephthya gigantea TaxID=151771 RepID=UPI00106A9288|nr:uncharacterized protein LOC114527910 isoform X1 [Dendronephthya gigantea]XP_028405428.1 uncharacterized protein LOC114527910 isoform X1 [Dendronephthya gigantea]